MTCSRPLLLAAGLVTAALAHPCFAQNLVPNGDFDTSLAGWNVGGGSNTVWASLDAGGSPGSGSVSVTNVHPVANVGTGVGQCIPLSPSSSYDLSAAVRFPSGQADTGTAYVRVTFYSTVDCASATSLGTGLTAVSASSSSGPFDTWKRGSGRVTSHAQSRAGYVQFSISKVQAGGAVQAYADDIVLSAAPAPSPRTLVIASSASIHGQNAAFFHTDAWVKNRSYDKTIEVTATYRCQEGFECPSSTWKLALQPRQTGLFSDVVGDDFELPETAGAIELTWDGNLGAISAASRTYTPDLPAPTNGTSVPAVDASAALTRALFLGLASNGADRSTGFRSNAGAYSRGPEPVAVTFRLTDASGALLGQTTRTAQPGRPFQINDVFAALGAGSTVTRNAVLEVSATAPVFPFVTVIDNMSGDSIWVLPTEDEAPLTATR